MQQTQTIDPNIMSCIERVRAELAQHLSKNEGCDLIDLEVLNIAKRGFSTTVFLQANTTARAYKMVMKKVVHDPINIAITKRENQAVVEFEILQKLYPKFQEVEGCAVPRPILVMPEIEALLIEFVEGRLLSEELGNARYWAHLSKFRKLQRYYYLCGRWLQLFQEFTGLEKAGAEAFDNLLERCDIRLKLIEEAGDSQCPKDLRRRTMNFLQEQVGYLKDGEVMIAGRHGDFGHWNIMVNLNAVVIFDFMGFTKEPIIYDILKMLLSLEYWKNHPAYSNRRLDALKETLLQGFGNLPVVPLQVATICEIYHRVSIIYACLSNPGNRWDQKLTTRLAYRKNLRALSDARNGKTIWSANRLR